MKMVINKEMSEAKLIVEVGTGYEQSLVPLPIITLHVPSLKETDRKR
jgi:hypothetical protein